jgi:N-acyl-D-aspartate/D-glutamate deacylase
MLDLLLRNGWVVDGTGAPRRRADVGVRGGRIAVVDRVDESARRTIDVDGLVVAPGFVDPHTHYDAQIMWDPAVTPSSLHGVTTVLGGNCGFTIAPMEPQHGDYLVPMLARVEGMPPDALAAGLDLEWKSYGSWLDRLDGNVGVNAGFLCGHSALRRLVMGESAVGEEATPEQVAAMVALLHESLADGALGFSSSMGQAHNDHHGDPVPSRFATREEMLELCAALREHEGTWIEFIPSIERLFTDPQRELMADMSAAAGGRSLNWNLLSVRQGEEERESRENRLGASDIAAERGGHVVALSVPDAIAARLSFATGFLLDTLPGWKEIVHAPVPERLRLLADANVRRRMLEGSLSNTARPFRDWSTARVSDVGDQALARYVGRRFGDIAAERGGTPFDAMLDIVVEDRLRTGIETPVVGDDDDSWTERVSLFRDSRVLVGGSDAGAHLDMMKTFAATSRFLGSAVRERGFLDLEEAVHLITDAPARFFGLRDRGRVAEGWWADLCVFDADRIDRGPIEMRNDLPAGAQRLTADAEGVAHVFVNGVEILHDHDLTGATPGTVLRSGRDTETALRV